MNDEWGFRQTVSDFNAAMTNQTPRAITLEMVRKIAADHGVAEREIYSASRRREVTIARCVAIQTIRLTHPQWSYPAIGRFFNRDHTTILHHSQKKCICHNLSAILIEAVKNRRTLNYELELRGMSLWRSRDETVKPQQSRTEESQGQKTGNDAAGTQEHPTAGET